jgi:OOP family OmpA-OmpF porin
MRAMTVASGQPQATEHVDARPQRKKAAKAFGAARKRLVKALIGGAASAKPAMAARAEAMFEFWTQEQEENNQQDHIDRCRIQFFIALAQIEQKAVMKAPAATTRHWLKSEPMSSPTRCASLAFRAV